MACRTRSAAGLCPACIRSLRSAPARVLQGVYVRSAFDHSGAARQLVHRLKYDGVWGVADRLAAVMATLLPDDATVLIPVPRVHARHLVHGVDPGRSLAVAVARRTGVPVIGALRPRVWTARRAGPSGQRRGDPGFTLAAPAPCGAVLIDDVVTSGATLSAAAAACGVRRALTATAGHSTLSRPVMSS